MNADPRTTLGEKIRAARLAQRYDVKAAAKAAGIARDTWVKIEAGESVQDTKRVAATQLLGLDLNGNPVGPSQQDDFVASPGAQVEAEATNDAVLREIRAMRREQREMLERLARLEQQGAKPLGGTSGPV